MSHRRHIETNIHVTVLSVLFLLIGVALHVFIQFATIALTRLFARGAFSTLTVRTVVPMFLPLLVEPDCVTAEVNIVEEEQNMWRRIEKGTKLQLDAGRRSALLLSTQRVKPHFHC